MDDKPCLLTTTTKLTTPSTQAAATDAEEASNLGDENSVIRQNAQIACENLTKSIQELESLFINPEVYIRDEIAELKQRIESKRDELKLVIDKEADKIKNTLQDLESELISKAKSSKHQEDKKSVIEKAQNTLNDWSEKLKQTDSKNEDMLKNIVNSGDKINSNLGELVETVKDGLLTSKYQEDKEAVALFSRVNIYSNLW